MNSRYLSHLEARIAKASGHPVEAELRLERVSCLARLGRVQEARDLLDELRAGVFAVPSLRTSVLFHIAEGLCHYYTNMGAGARDRFARASALAAAAGQDDLAARSASWQALVQYGAHEFAEMMRSLEVSLGGSSSADAETLARSCLLVAQSIHIANRFSDAFPWYRRARHYCARTEDDLTISALMHNMAAIWASNARNASLGGPLTEDSSQRALSGAIASLNFDQLVGISSLEIFAPLLRAQIESINGNFNEANAIYRDQLASLSIESMKGWQAWLICDFGWNLLKAGFLDEARSKFQIAEAQLSSDMHSDDRAAALIRLAAAYLELGEPAKSRELKSQADQSWEKFAQLQGEILRIIESSEILREMVHRNP